MSPESCLPHAVKRSGPKKGSSCQFKTSAPKRRDHAQARRVRLIAFTPVHPKFTSGALLEKRSYARVIRLCGTVYLGGRRAPVPYCLCQVLQDKPRKPPSSSWRLAQKIFSPNVTPGLHSCDWRGKSGDIGISDIWRRRSRNFCDVTSSDSNAIPFRLVADDAQEGRRRVFPDQ